MTRDLGARPIVGAIAILIAIASCSDVDEPTLAAPTSTQPGTTPPSSAAVPTPTVPTPTVLEDPSSTTSTTEAAPAASTEPSGDEAIAERIRDYFDAREVANAASGPDPAHPALAETATGVELANLVEETTARRDAGRAIRPGEQDLAAIRVGSVVFGELVASAAVCSIDDGVVFDVASGEVVDDSILTHSYTVELAVAEGKWKVSRIARVQQWEGVAGCAMAPADYPL